jgi:CheY-like chemotaxis protein
MTMKRILLVEDNIDYAEDVKEFLEIFEFDVVVANSGNEALNFIQNEGYKFDIIISDVKMPDGDGFYLLDQLSKSNRLAPYYIFLTGAVGLTKEIKDSEAVGVLAKPLSLEKLLDIINNNPKQDAS